MAGRSLTAALKTAGVAGALLGAAAVGAAVGALGRRSRRSTASAPTVEAPFPSLSADAVTTVQTPDGIELHVEVVNPTYGDRAEAAPITAVFVHGFCLDMGTWYYQRSALTALAAVSAASSEAESMPRLVFYDQAGHGRSGRRSAGEYTLDQLATDLYHVVDQVAPDGKLLLIGHSMGGMVLMAFAQRYPELFASRVCGAALLSTSAGHLDEVALGLPRFVTRLRKPLMPTIAGTLKTHPRLGELSRASGSELSHLLTRHFAFGSAQVPPELISYVERMNAATAIEVIAGYLGTLSEHDRYAALPAFAEIETLIVCGDADRVTPVAHTREIARMVPSAELVEVRDGGHLTLMEHHEVVTTHLTDWLARSCRRAADGR